MSVTMTCMTTKKKFEVENPEVVVLANGRYAFKAVCPWEGKNGKELTAWKFCSTSAYDKFKAASESKHSEDGSEPDSESEH